MTPVKREVNFTNMAKAKTTKVLTKTKASKKAKANKKLPVLKKEKLSSKKDVETALDGRKKLVLQKRNKDTIVYVRMKPNMFDRFEEAYAKYCTDNLLNPASYGMSTFVRENAYANLKVNGQI